ncbi:MAG: hypothetical protein O7E52_10230, partial [Candidatus Poribacteria bacterium]|nr:hypothetical protein [Candidatus Poribacteria bacterium]
MVSPAREARQSAWHDRQARRVGGGDHSRLARFRVREDDEVGCGEKLSHLLLGDPAVVNADALYPFQRRGRGAAKAGDRELHPRELGPQTGKGGQQKIQSLIRKNAAEKEEPERAADRIGPRILRA